MTVTIVGAQLGDEGKGGIVDLYGDAADVVVRYQGGDNAGHTVVHGGEEYKLSLAPSGAIRGKVNVLGNGCVVNPRTAPLGTSESLYSVPSWTTVWPALSPPW